jgi:hypothetical protein
MDHGQTDREGTGIRHRLVRQDADVSDPTSESPLDPVFVITRDGDFHLFKSLDQAAGWVEAVDVLDGEYVDFIRVTGERLRAVASASPNAARVVLEPTGVIDLDYLQARLHALASRNGYDGPAENPREIANQVFANEWRSAWPRWWPWLHQRLHGEGPPVV